MNPPQPSWRKPAGVLLILAIIILWSVLIASVAGWFSGVPILVQAIFYLIAGIIWIVPVRPILMWMETGKWRQ